MKSTSAKRKKLLLQEIEQYAINDFDRKVIEIFTEELGGITFCDPPDILIRIGRRIAELEKKVDVIDL